MHPVTAHLAHEPFQSAPILSGPTASLRGDSCRHFNALFRKIARPCSSAARIAPMVESSAVLRHVLGSFRKECSWTHRQS